MIHTGRHFLQIPAAAAAAVLPQRVSAPSASGVQRVTQPWTSVQGERSENGGERSETEAMK